MVGYDAVLMPRSPLMADNQIRRDDFTADENRKRESRVKFLHYDVVRGGLSEDGEKKERHSPMDGECFKPTRFFSPDVPPQI